MNPENLKRLLDGVASGRTGVEQAIEELRELPFRSLGDVCFDSHRMLRRGIPESIYGSGKTALQIADALKTASLAGANCVVTRIEPQVAEEVQDVFARSGTAGRLTHHRVPRMLSLAAAPDALERDWFIAVVTAGTSDIPVAEEAAVTLETGGDRVVRIRDVGVAGVHRLAPHISTLNRAAAIIVAAGMEGALPGVIAGIVSSPVIGIPTSIGYGTAFGGITALLAMLNSCAGGLTVVNIDNGYGAAAAAHLIGARSRPPKEEET